MLTNGGEARVLGENSPLALALPKALGRAIVSESETRSDCIKSSLVVMISVTFTKAVATPGPEARLHFNFRLLLAESQLPHDSQC